MRSRHCNTNGRSVWTARGKISLIWSHSMRIFFSRSSCTNTKKKRLDYLHIWKKSKNAAFPSNIHPSLSIGFVILLLGSYKRKFIYFLFDSISSSVRLFLGDWKTPWVGVCMDFWVLINSKNVFDTQILTSCKSPPLSLSPSLSLSLLVDCVVCLVLIIKVPLSFLPSKIFSSNPCALRQSIICLDMLLVPQ